MTIREFSSGFYYSFPVQLFLLHLRKYQILLLFWFILFTTVNGYFLKTFGADSLFLGPEYLGNVNALSMVMVGVGLGIFIMSWNITTFILHSRHFKFLATTTKPFLKYFINNSVIPLLFIIYYSYMLVQYYSTRELLGTTEILFLLSGFYSGLVVMILISLIYFFGAEKTMLRKMEPVISAPHLYTGQYGLGGKHHHEKGLIHVEWFFNTRFKLKKPREIAHYSQEFIKTIFKRHHFSAVISIILAFLLLATLGLFQDSPAFKIPAASAILLLFSILIAASGALVYWLKSWSFLALILAILIFNFMLHMDWVDPRNKAYGLNYSNIEERPVYSRASILNLCTVDKMEKDRDGMIAILNEWKRKQPEQKPVMFMICVSGGGTRSANFTVNVLQKIDSMMNGQLMHKTFMITGASGGMLGATYYRELYRMRQMGRAIKLTDSRHVDAVSRDLLNPLFSSMVTRDIFAPAQKFTMGDQHYIKDRAYAFEQQLNENTSGVLDHQLKDYKDDESNARIPLIFFNATNSADGRKMVISTQPVSFMMRNWPDSSSGILGEPDAIDFCSFFSKQEPQNLRMLSAMRINATFPYVLPNVWLPSQPVVDVMDAGIRDNYGQETMIRFLQVFNDWIKENTSGVVMIQIRDRKLGDWEDHSKSTGITDLITKPMTVIQLNWMKLQDYYQEELVSLGNEGFAFPFEKLNFSYIPAKNTKAAALNFHLTTKEKIDIGLALFSTSNRQSFSSINRIYTQSLYDSSGTIRGPGVEAGHEIIQKVE